MTVLAAFDWNPLIAGAAGIIGALIGGLTTLAVSRQSWNRTLTLEIVDEVSQITAIAWNEVEWRDAQQIETRVRFRLAILGITEKTADNLFVAARDCRSSVIEQEDTGGIGVEGEIGLRTELVDRLDNAQRALSRELAKLRRRRARP